MIDTVSLARLGVITSLVLCVLGIVWRLRAIMSRPFNTDLARARGSAWRGVLYAFTLGMAPWEKESARIHWIAYLRGISFHMGTFAAFGVLFASPWLAILPRPMVWIAIALTSTGAAAGLGGVVMRWADRNERALSVPDDYASVILVSLFTALACAVLLWPAVMSAWYLVSALMLIYIPFSKIRHCVYFFYSRFFFGLYLGRRGVIGQSQSQYTY